MINFLQRLRWQHLIKEAELRVIRKGKEKLPQWTIQMVCYINIFFIMTSFLLMVIIGSNSFIPSFQLLEILLMIHRFYYLNFNVTHRVCYVWTLAILICDAKNSTIEHLNGSTSGAVQINYYVMASCRKCVKGKGACDQHIILLYLYWI